MRVVREHPTAETGDHCASGGIGRRTGFRFQRRKAWGFKSLLAHEFENRWADAVGLGMPTGTSCAMPCAANFEYVMLALSIFEDSRSN